MFNYIILSRKYRFMLALVLIAFFIVFMAWYFSNIFAYVIISVVISTILRPLTNYLNQINFFKLRIPRPLAVLLSFLAMILVLSIFVFLFVPLISDQIEVLSTLDYDNLIVDVFKPLEKLEDFLIENSLTDSEMGFLVEGARQKTIDMFKNINFSNLLNGVVSVTGSFFVGALAVIFITFFLLLENGLLRNLIVKLIPNEYFEMTIEAFTMIESLLSNYLLGILFQMFSIFSIASVGLSIFGVNYALTIALFAALANLIPYLGPILGATFGIIVGLSTVTDLSTANDYLFLMLKVASVFGVVQLTDNIVLQPVIFSKSVKAHPLEIFIVIFAGANVGGVLGMIAAIPVYTILRVAVLEIRKGYKQYYIFKQS
ncbi:AI-2E family transporter [Aureibacter tunicatorum]|uniref:PurR-regulated permease PerM n=1 Tax=Aureibacter tunicatorum TaxID=866807 RepID=A0AAE3XK50_9BACT|nr:AI-2E family transporter [Aureibacter tunicatorum]MDR6238382.1 putative PurR-regulated permease PerM [Aureibacter tunicatorum]BDD03414.1 AI-2E family transporter [Aureibacter tunicatorum]